MKLANMGYDWVVVDGYPGQAFWKQFVEVGRITLHGKLKRKK